MSKFTAGRRFPKTRKDQLILAPSVTPGPNAYSKLGTLESDDPNKHFGFLTKSDRFNTLNSGLSRLIA